MYKYELTRPGEWKTDDCGRSYQYDGYCVEFEPKITTSHGTLTRRQLDALNAREKAKPAPTAVKFPSSKSCPFRTGMNKDCRREACAWFDGTGCAQSCPHPATGKKCPHNNYNCTNECALRKDITNE